MEELLVTPENSEARKRHEDMYKHLTCPECHTDLAIHLLDTPPTVWRNVTPSDSERIQSIGRVVDQIERLCLRLIRENRRPLVRSFEREDD